MFPVRRRKSSPQGASCLLLATLLCLPRSGFALHHGLLRYQNGYHHEHQLCHSLKSDSNAYDSYANNIPSEGRSNIDDAKSESERNAKGSTDHWHVQQFHVDTDVRPKRPHALLDAHQFAASTVDWGIERQSEPPTFPGTVDELTDTAFDAIVGTLHGTQRYDPNVASNAMSRNTVFDYRPVKSAHDAGRIGIEIDGAAYLRNNAEDRGGNHDGQSNLGIDSGGSALRRVVLDLAQKLSTRTIAKETAKKTFTTTTSDKDHSRPVVVYFNTVKQALMASRQLQVYKQIERNIVSSGGSNNIENTVSTYDNVTILCLGRDVDLPLQLHKPREKSKSVTHNLTRKLREGAVDPTRGLVIVVQPTDFNNEYRPPGPAIGAMEAFQRLAARATVQGLPLIAVSPRFLRAQDSTFGLGVGRGWDQSAGSQQSAIYGGLEPPKGPTPWILRDFNPPVYCWVANALLLGSRDRHRRIPHHDNHGHHSKEEETHDEVMRVALSQSVMDAGHPWHAFAAQKSRSTEEGSSRSSYVYLASTKTSAGRPTRGILRRIFDEHTLPT